MRQEPQTANKGLPGTPVHFRKGSFRRRPLLNSISKFIAGIGLATVAASASVFVPGYLSYEFYPGSDRTTVEAGGVPLNTGGTVVGSDKNGPIPSFESGTNFADSYANRIYGYFIPPATGDYVFFIACDDDGDLFLSSDATAANKHLIAQESGWSGVRSYNSVGGGSQVGDKRSDTFASSEWPGGGDPIHLTGGSKYYIEAVHHEGGGGDNIAVTYKLKSDPDPKNGAAPRLAGAVVGTDVDTAPAAPNISITTQPVGGTVYLGGNITMSVVVSSDSPYPVAYQWRKGGTAIAGANSTSYSLGAPALSDTGSYDVQASVPGPTGAPVVVTSTAVTITVQSSPFETGFLKYEFFPGLDRVTVEGGGGTPSYAGSVVGADKSGYINIFETAINFFDNYANRISGVFIPPTTADYVFYIAADDDSDLFLSTDDSPANKKLIAQEAGWSNSRNWNTIGGGSTVEGKRSDQCPVSEWAGAAGAGATIHLTAGNHYYIEAVHHEGGGGDFLDATYRLATDDEALTADGTASRLTGPVIGVSVPPAQQLDITTQPTATTVYAGTPAHLSIVAITDSKFSIQYQWRKDGTPVANASGPNYSFISSQLNAGGYDVVLTVPGLSKTSTVATVTVKTGAITVNNKFKHEFFSGASRQDVENGNVGNATYVEELSSFETGVNFADNYANRISGYFIPATTGNYVFFVASDDDSDLFLSTDDTPANKRLIAQEQGWSNNRQWLTSGSSTDAAYLAQKRSDQWTPDGTTHPFASGIALTAGTKYYIEGVHHEGGGGDNFSATFKLSTDPDPVDGDATKLTNSVIAYVTSPVAAATITTQPASLTQYEAQAATFTVAVNTDSELTPLYQWRKGGTPIANANASTYYIGFLAPTDAGSFDVQVTVPNSNFQLTSTPATLQVLSAPLITGLLKYDYFPGKDRPGVENGTAGTPSTSGYQVGGDNSGYITIFESAVNFADGYANRISGYFIPPATDNYVFFIAADDDSDFFLSTDDTPANKKLVAQEAGWSANRRWATVGGGSTNEDKRSDSFANSQWPGGGATIHLTAGKLYYMEAVHHEGGGGDNLAVTYKLAAGTDPNDLDASALKGAVVGVKVVPQALGTTPPTVHSAIAPLVNVVTLTFSAPLDHATATVTGNYNLGAGVTVNSADAREVFQGSDIVSIVTLKTTGATACKAYTLAISNIKDANGNAIAAGTTVPINTPCLTLDFNSDTLPAGVSIADQASIVAGLGPDGSGAAQITDAANSQQGALRIGDLVSGATVTNFTIAFKLFIGNGTGNPADGMSFNFGNIPDSTTSVGEEGTGLISIDFDTYNNGNTGPGGKPEAPAFEVKLSGAIIGWVPLPQAAIVNDEWVDVVVQLNSDNSITTIYNGLTYFDHLPLTGAVNLVTGAPAPAYTPISGGLFLIGGRTGNENTRQAMDDLSIVENGVSAVGPPPTGQPKLTVTVSGAGLSISWTPTGGTLESSPTIGAGSTWTTVGTQNPTAVTPAATGNQFYRVHVP